MNNKEYSLEELIPMQLEFLEKSLQEEKVSFRYGIERMEGKIINVDKEKETFSIMTSSGEELHNLDVAQIWGFYITQ